MMRLRHRCPEVALAVRASRSGKKSRKHSSTTSTDAAGGAFVRACSVRKSRSVSVTPVGLLGWHKKTSVQLLGRRHRRRSSVTAKSFSSLQEHTLHRAAARSPARRRTRQRWARAPAPAGAGAASARRKIRSAAPLPQRICSGGYALSLLPAPSRRVAAERVRVAVCRRQRRRDGIAATPSGRPSGLTLAEKSSASCPNLFAVARPVSAMGQQSA